MNWLDGVLIVVAVVSVIAGLKTGLVRSALGLAAVVIGLLFALWFYGAAGATLEPYVHTRHVANAIGFSAILVGVLLVGALIGRLLEKLLKVAHLSWLDRLLGGAFGAARALLVAGVIVLAIMAFAPKPPPQAVAHSRLAPYAIDAARTMAAAAPYEVKEAFRQSYERIREIWAGTVKPGVKHLPSQTI